MLSVALLLSASSVSSYAAPSVALKDVETLAHSTLGKEALHQALKNLTGEEILKLAGITVVNADDVVQISSEVIKQLRNEQASHDAKTILTTLAKTIAREKTLVAVDAAAEQIATRTNLSLPDFIKQNAKLRYILGIIYRDIARQTVDAAITKLTTKSN